MSDKYPADGTTKAVPFFASMLRRIRTLFGFGIHTPKTMEQLEKESPELAKYISELENRVS